MSRRGRRKNNVKYIIIGILLIGIATFSFASLFVSSVGPVGRWSKALLQLFFGEGRYILPILIGMYGFALIRKNSRKGLSQKVYGVLMLYICCLTFYHLLIPVDYSFEAGKSGEGGGITGAIFSYVFQRAFGLIGTFIFLGVIGLVAVTMLSGVSPFDLVKAILAGIKRYFARVRDMLSNFLFTDVEEEEIDESKVFDSVLMGADDNEISVLGGPLEVENGRFEASDKRRKKRDGVKVEHNGKKHSGKKVQQEAGSLEQDNYNQIKKGDSFKLPPISLLKAVRGGGVKTSRDIGENVRVLQETLQSFGINARVTHVSRGPAITRYEIQPPTGVKVSKIVGLADDIALGMAAPDVRIEAPIPGKAAVGIEVPNKEISIVRLRELLETDEFQESGSPLTMALGKDIAGNPVIADLTRMPHLLIAGATGSGKSVCLNTLIASILFKSTPDEVKFLIVDPKRVELSNYNGIPHLISPVVTDAKKAATSLRWVVKEMEKRYELFAAVGVRDIARYNIVYGKNETADEQNLLPLIVVIIDELSDLMMVAPADVEDTICRLAQMARAAGIHLIVATQRPSVDVITGLIKANIPSRISFAVSSQSDSRTILDMGGAEKLLGKGDMLFYPVGASKPIRVQGAYLSDKEVENLTEFLKKQAEPDYEEEVFKEEKVEDNIAADEDELLPKAVEVLVQTGHASISMLQRRLRIGYARAARLIDVMEKKGIVGGYEGSKPRAVLITKEEYQEKYAGQK